MQLQDIIKAVRQEIGEPSVDGQIGTQTGAWSDTQIIGYINDAQGLLAKPARIQAAPVTISLVPGTYAYNLPSDCLEDGLRKVSWVSSGPNGSFEVKPVGLDQWRKLFDEQPLAADLYPMYSGVYMQWAGEINILPVPDSENQSDTLTVYYYKQPPNLANITDVSLIPSRFHVALVYYAIARCQAAVEESQLQMLAMQQYEQYAEQLRQERSVETRDRPGRVRARR